MLSDADRQILAERSADRYDVSLLTAVDATGQRRTVTEVSPLWLIQVSGQFGWTVTETRRRMARLEPLGLVINCPVAQCPDEVVHWQDLLAVTVHLDGQEPALSGSVGLDHLTLAASELEETVAAVRFRLNKYAGLFGFSLQPSPDAEEKTTVV
jgi:hypothetical protein